MLIIKHAQHIGIIRAFCLPGGLWSSVPVVPEKITELWFARGVWGGGWGGGGGGGGRKYPDTIGLLIHILRD